jgi:small subunit ribosomal protein S17e
MAIKPKYIKQLGNLLLEKYPQAFNTDFETNKDSVDKLTNVDSKGVRNRIAGYITRKKGGATPTA